MRPMKRYYRPTEYTDRPIGLVVVVVETCLCVTVQSPDCIMVSATAGCMLLLYRLVRCRLKASRPLSDRHIILKSSRSHVVSFLAPVAIDALCQATLLPLMMTMTNINLFGYHCVTNLKHSRRM